jgi:hypothetical protein
MYAAVRTVNHLRAVHIKGVIQTAVNVHFDVSRRVSSVVDFVKIRQLTLLTFSASALSADSQPLSKPTDSCPIKITRCYEYSPNLICRKSKR